MDSSKSLISPSLHNKLSFNDSMKSMLPSMKQIQQLRSLKISENDKSRIQSSVSHPNLFENLSEEEDFESVSSQSDVDCKFPKFDVPYC